jgi:hypothetical protein
MKVCGFTIVRNALKYDYPVKEAILSVLPVCDEFLVAVGNSEDETLQLIQSINSPKIKIIETVWDDSLREGGTILAVETNKAIDAISHDFDWLFYIQADEVLHEKYHAEVLKEMNKWMDDTKTEGLLFKYVHFYGSYNYVGDSRNWYRNEIRVIKNDKSIRSFKDAQGFRKNGQKLSVRAIDAEIYHYGWVKHPKYQQAKQENFNKLWHSDEWVEQNVVKADEYDYKRLDILKKFQENHPLVMQSRVESMNWKFEYNTQNFKPSLKLKFLNIIEKVFGWRVGEYKNYKLIK